MKFHPILTAPVLMLVATAAPVRAAGLIIGGLVDLVAGADTPDTPRVLDFHLLGSLSQDLRSSS